MPPYDDVLGRIANTSTPHQYFPAPQQSYGQEGNPFMMQQSPAQYQMTSPALRPPSQTLQTASFPAAVNFASDFTAPNDQERNHFKTLSNQLYMAWIGLPSQHRNGVLTSLHSIFRQVAVSIPSQLAQMQNFQHMHAATVQTGMQNTTQNTYFGRSVQTTMASGPDLTGKRPVFDLGVSQPPGSHALSPKTGAKRKRDSKDEIEAVSRPIAPKPDAPYKPHAQHTVQSIEKDNLKRQDSYSTLGPDSAQATRADVQHEMYKGISPIKLNAYTSKDTTAGAANEHSEARQEEVRRMEANRVLMAQYELDVIPDDPYWDLPDQSYFDEALANCDVFEDLQDQPQETGTANNA